MPKLVVIIRRKVTNGFFICNFFNFSPITLLGKSHNENVYCKVTLGNQEQETDFAKDSMNNGNVPQNGVPQIPSLAWNCSMQFQLRNLNEENLNFVVLQHNPYSLDGKQII